MIRFLIFFLICIIGLFLRQVLRIALHANKTSYSKPRFERQIPQSKLKFLFVGDSTAVGTGAVSNTESVAGWFGQDFPDAQITNRSHNGKKIADLLREFHPAPKERYDLIVMQIGANDIMRFTPYKNIERDLSELIKRAQTISNHVVILHSGNVGLAPTFVWPFDWIFAERSRGVREIYMRKAKETSVLYVDLFTERSNDLFLTDIERYYSPDHLHPSGQGYRWWYERIRETLKDANVSLN